MSNRPERVQIKDELGKFKSLAAGADHFESYGSGNDVLILGLGPDPGDAAKAAGDAEKVRYVEAPAFISQMPPGRQEAVPATWRRIEPGDVDRELILSSRILVHRQAAGLFPSFWGPVLARLRLALARAKADQPDKKLVVLPAGRNDLLAPELARAFSRAGYETVTIEADKPVRRLQDILARGRPALYFSVNFKGLDPLGDAYHLLAEAGVPVAAWLVDNPFHLVSAMRSPYWRELELFVTDASFMSLLSRHGAKSVHHLPLAADPEFMGRGHGSAFPELGDRIVFVGRSEFPDKDKFFAGCRVPDKEASDARSIVKDGGRPDYNWWLDALGLENLWPGAEARQAGFCAETSARNLRAEALKAASSLPLTVFGDPCWAGLVPEIADLRGPVDYYTALPGIYASSGLSLNVTSLLLPAGLTQRHFDVWAAGGVLVTDATPGLTIFPEYLTREISFERPDELPEVAGRLAADERLKRDLRTAWHDLILAEHTFDHRVASIMGTMDL